jgi:cytochrome c553
MSRRKIVLLAVALGLASQAASGADLKRAEQIVAGKCFLCHGLDGDSSSPLFPRLAGQHADYIARQLADFKSGKRKSETMSDMAKDLTPEEMGGLGAYFQAKPVEPRQSRDPELAAVGRYIFHKGNPYSGVAACAGCHGEKGLGTPQLPRLAGQQPSYTASQLKQFNTRERTNDNAVMHAIASRLTELEVKAVAEYIGILN